MHTQPVFYRLWSRLTLFRTWGCLLACRKTCKVSTWDDLNDTDLERAVTPYYAQSYSAAGSGHQLHKPATLRSVPGMHTLHACIQVQVFTYLDGDHRPLGALRIATHVDCAIGPRGELLYGLIALWEVGRTRRSIRPLQPIQPTAVNFCRVYSPPYSCISMYGIK